MDTIPGTKQDDPAVLLGALLRTAYRAFMDEFEPGMAAAGYADVRLTHTPVLQPLSVQPEGLRASELAAMAHMAKPSMGYLIDHLEQCGYVERLPDPTDGRAQLVRLTPRGWEMTRTGRHLIRQMEDRWVALVGREQVEGLRQHLRTVLAALQHETRSDTPSKP